MERTNEESLDLFADLLEPVSAILADKEIADIRKKGGNTVAMVSKAIKNHKAEIIQILSLIDGIPTKEYKVNIISLPIKVLNLLNMPEMQELFTTQGQKSAVAYSGSATESTEDGAN